MKDINFKGKLIMIMGPPASGKSTLASEVHTELKKRNINSVFVGEAATDYIAEYGVPDSPNDQMVIFYKQLNKDLMFLDSKDYIICDSSSILNYFYFRSLFDSKLSNKDIKEIFGIDVGKTDLSRYRKNTPQVKPRMQSQMQPQAMPPRMPNVQANMAQPNMMQQQAKPMTPKSMQSLLKATLMGLI